MVETLNLKEKNIKIKVNNNKKKGRTMPVEQVMGLSLCVSVEKLNYNHHKGGP